MSTGIRVVCISRAAAACGEEIGQAVSKQLGFRYVDDEIVRLASERAGIDASVVAEAEWPRSTITRLVDAMDDFAQEVTSPSAWFSRLSQQSVRSLIREAVLMVADRGQAVILAHAASIVLGHRPDVLRVLVTASVDTRIERFYESDTTDGDADAAVAVEESDRDRRQYLELFYGVREELPTLYDLVINTDRLSTAQATAIILAAAGR